MKRFVFRLETLLRHRERIEEQEQTKFSRIRWELQGECDRRRALADSRDRTREELAGVRQCDSQEFLFAYRFLEYLASEMKRSDERIAELEKKLDAQKQTMIAATRDRKIIQNLKGKKEKEYQFSLQREEQKFIDDLVVTRFAVRP